MHTTLLPFLLFLVYPSIIFVLAQLELPLGSSLPQTPAIPVLTLTTNAILILDVTSIITKTDVIIVSPTMLATFTKLSTSIDTAIMTHGTSISSRPTQSFFSTEPSMSIDKTDTNCTDSISSNPAQSSPSNVLSTLIDTAVTTHIAPISSNPDECLPSTVLSTSIGKADTTHTTFISSRPTHTSPSSSSGDLPMPADTTDTTEMASISTPLVQSSPSNSTSHLSMPIDTAETTLTIPSTSQPIPSSIDTALIAHSTSISSHTVQNSPSNPPSHLLTDTTKMPDVDSISPSPTQSLPYSSSGSLSIPLLTTEITRTTLISSHTDQSSSYKLPSNFPTTTVITIQDTSILSYPAQSLPSSSSSYQPDSTTVVWITRSAWLSPSTTTTTVTYPLDGFRFTPTDLAGSRNMKIAAHEIQTYRDSHSLQISTINTVTLLGISATTVPVAINYVKPPSSQNSTSASDSNFLFDTSKTLNSGFGSESNATVTTEMIPTSTLVNNPAVIASLKMSAQAMTLSSRMGNSIPGTIATTSKLPDLNSAYPLTHSYQDPPTSSLIRLGSSFLINHTAPISPISPPSETKISTPNSLQTFEPSQASNSIQAINTTQARHSHLNASQSSSQNTPSLHSMYSIASYLNAIPTTLGTITAHTDSTKVQPTDANKKQGRRSRLDIIQRRVDSRSKEQGRPETWARDEEISQAGKFAADMGTLVFRIVPLGLLIFVWLL
ncbi:hypothetical protein DSL72_001928 [Monilinia vaccinii-corymbosi]|uniref:Uncharacterized protein n=1 Tax=Monilinia vaccinii-corymbosi TaxID=61207 RepID=A0A8A3PB82_9HELO|nr:hypothetical protein DSL72_001928 [Monilinia vaccinii-corymbosi]